MGILARNPAEMVDPPRKKRPQIFTLAPRHIHRFISAIRESHFGLIYYTGFVTGERLGELLAHTWRDVDLDNGFMSVTRALMKRSGIIEIKEPKTDYGRRRIDIPASLERMLREHRRAEEIKGEMIGRPLEETDLLFCHPDNRCWTRARYLIISPG